MKKRRKECGLRLIDLAEKTGYSPSWLWALENGYHKGISHEVKRKVAETLKKSIKELFGN